MEITLLLNLVGGAAVVYCGAIFLLSAGMFFFDRKPAQKASLQPVRFDAHEEQEEERRAA